MHFTKASLVLTALAVAEASAASVGLGKTHNHAARHADIAKAHHEARHANKRDLAALSSAGSSLLTKLGCKGVGINAAQKSGTNPWLGADGQWTNEFVNTAGEDLHLVVWGPAGSWVNAVQPQITVSIPSNTSRTISFPNGWSGAWAPVYQSSNMVNGQISDTWGEGTFNAPYSVVDVSREVNMKGRNMKIVGPQCTSDMNTCVFKCKTGDVCLTGYELVNCATGSQAGANFGWYDGAASGGCGGMGQGANLKTYLG